MSRRKKKKTGDSDTVEQGTDTQKTASVEVNSGDGKIEVKVTSADEDKSVDQAPVEETPVDEKAELSAQVAQLEDQLLRAMAEHENFKKRMARQYDENQRAARIRVLEPLLEIIDNFERALEHAANGASEDADALEAGTKLIYQQMLALLEKFEVKPIEALGKQFDPQYHEALMQVETQEYDEGLVAMEITKGYLIGDRILRHAKVGVSSPKKEEDSAASE